jgi:hypothetical protein
MNWRFMRSALRLVTLSSCALLPVACAGSPPPSAPLPPGCSVTTGGPVVAPLFQPGPPPAGRGGDLVDGTYDLVQLVMYGPDPANPTIGTSRWSLEFSTQERSSNHTEGTFSMAIDVPLVTHTCGGGRYATLGTSIRTRTEKRMEENQYTATPDSLTLIRQSPGDAEVQVFVFRRR